MHNFWACGAAFLAAGILMSSPVNANKARQGLLAGWWGYDQECPASDNGFGLAADGSASDGRGAYAGRWSLDKGHVTIIWNAIKADRQDIKPSEWRVVENFRLISEPQKTVMLVDIKNSERAWLCRKY